MNIKNREYKPEKTIKAYKLFRTLKSKPGKLFPLFIGKGKEVPINQWVQAESIPTKGYAKRPGWHSGIAPIAPHLVQKSTGKISPDRVWTEIEIPADIEWQSVADNNPTKDMRDRIPVNGYYQFKTNKMYGGIWNISGAIKINKILLIDDVNFILKKK